MDSGTLIVIDGSNVAMNYGHHQTFACRGLRIAVEFFRRRGHEVTVYVPEWRGRAISGERTPIKDQHVLEELMKEGLLVYTPSRSYDDRYILDCAAKYKGVVVSNDRYRDLYNGNDDWKDVISNRLLQFKFIRGQFTPLGRNGPNRTRSLKNHPSQPDRFRNNVQSTNQPTVARPIMAAAFNGNVPPRFRRLLDRTRIPN